MPILAVLVLLSLIGLGSGSLIGPPILAAAAAPAEIPSWDTIAQLGPSGLLAFGLWYVASGRLVPASLHDRAEKRAELATAAAEKSLETARESIAALARIADEHRAEREEWARELQGLTREIHRLSGGA